MRVLTRQPGGEGDLPAELRCTLEQRDAVTGLGGHACRLEPRDAAADDHHVLRFRRAWGRPYSKPASGFWTQAIGNFRSRLATQTFRPTHSRISSSSPRGGFPDQVGIGDLRPRHPDEVAASVGERSLTDFGLRDAALGDDDRVGYGLLDGLCEGNSEPGLVVEGRHQQVEVVVVAVADAEVIDVAVLGQVCDRVHVARHRAVTVTPSRGSSPIAVRSVSRISRASRIRFSSEPPYRSERRLRAPDMNPSTSVS